MNGTSNLDSEKSLSTPSGVYLNYNRKNNESKSKN
uniref:Uncharacterized protein n=1 Tax=Siphoviridae sp. ctfZQ2 TaxID=2826415 RepID=A0A8S5NCK2_9CAUD|nr:MAG TPA: hypothetical protein [Siphoviridae sp. ctfZQ2]